MAGTPQGTETSWFLIVGYVTTYVRYAAPVRDNQRARGQRMQESAIMSDTPGQEVLFNGRLVSSRSDFKFSSSNEWVIRSELKCGSLGSLLQCIIHEGADTPESDEDEMSEESNEGEDGDISEDDEELTDAMLQKRDEIRRPCGETIKSTSAGWNRVKSPNIVLFSWYMQASSTYLGTCLHHIGHWFASPIECLIDLLDPTMSVFLLWQSHENITIAFILEQSV